LDVLTDDVAVFAIPGAHAAAMAERVSMLAKANSVLAKFHTLRRTAVESGQKPTIKDSLAAMAPGA
jgi:hypothetical protein